MTGAPGRTESAIAIARVRVGESVAAHARSIGILDLPADRFAMMVDHAVKLLETLSPSELANLSPGTGQLAAAVTSSFNAVYGQLNEGQLRALRHGIDPGNLAAVQAFLASGENGILVGGGAFGTALHGGRANYRAALDGIDGVSPQKLAAYSAQFGDLGFNQATVGLFAAVDLDRRSYDGFLKQGYSVGAIKDAASDTKALGWTGSDAVGDTIRAPDVLRDAAIAAVNAKTDDERAARIDELGKVYEGLSEAEKERSEPFVRRLNDTHANLRLNLGDEAARDQADTTLANAAPIAIDRELDSAYAHASARAETAGEATAIAQVDDVFGAASLKPEPKAPTVPVRAPAAGPG